MANEPLPPPPSGDDAPLPLPALAGVGCLTAVAGFFGGAMIGVLIAKIVGSIRGCQPVEGAPACEWFGFAFYAGLVGLVLLPTISIIRLKGRRS